MGNFKRIISILTISALLLYNLPVSLAAADADHNTNSFRLILEYRESANTDAAYRNVKEENQKLSVDVIREMDDNMEVVQVSGDCSLKDALSCFENDADVELVQPDYRISCDDSYDNNIPDDEFFTYQWGLYNSGQWIGDYGVAGVDINILPAWEITKGSRDVVVGVLDTGVDISHDDLMNNIYVNKDEIPGNNVDDDQNGYIDDVNGWDFLNHDNTVYDGYDGDVHGTFAAGIIAASGNNGVGISGAAPEVTICPLKFIGAENGYTSDAIEAIQYAEKMGIDVINCSWGGTDYNKALEKTMKKSNILFICAAGNESRNLKEVPYYPACFNINNIISVGAIDNTGSYAEYSNYGKKVDLAAPGSYILSTIPENGYSLGSGTSFAAPFVTAIAALVKSEDRSMRCKKIRDLIIRNVTVDKLLQNKVNTCGRADAFKVLSNMKHKKE